MEIGCLVKTLVEKRTSDGERELLIPVGTMGVLCEIHDTWAFIEIETVAIPEGAGVFGYNLDEFVVV